MNIKFKLTEKNMTSMHNNIIKKLRLFQIIPTRPKINKVDENIKQIINGIVSLFEKISVENISVCVLSLLNRDLLRL
jgi:hypothetical protein